MRQERFEFPERVLQYSYKVDDRSLLAAPIRRWICNPLLGYLPRSLSPNVLTLCGHLAVIGAFGWGLVQDHPATSRAAALIPALAIVTLLIADNVDGLQARRLGVSGPLGDLLDHGLDPLAGILVPLAAFIAYGAATGLTVAAVILIGIAWWVGTAERWVTGEVRLPPLSETELYALVLAVHLVALVAGPATLQVRIFGVSATDAVASFCLLSALAVIAGKAWHGGPVLRAVPGLLATLLPLLAWYALVRATAPALAASVTVPLIFGVAVCTHIVELLRRCLIGTRALPFDAILIAIGCWLLLSTVLGWTAGVRPAVALLAVVARFAWQLVETVSYIMRRRGDRLLSIR